jgi:YD repeat-containing protein
LQTSRDTSGVTTYTFDANGNQQVVEAPGGGRTTYTWDYENETTLVQLPTGARVTMAYNADNRRVWKDT